jgi:hypothetical protein
MTKKITFETSPLYYGKNNITDAFQKGEYFGFELAFCDEKSTQRNILTLDQVLELKKQIDNALIACDEGIAICEKLK